MKNVLVKRDFQSWLLSTSPLLRRMLNPSLVHEYCRYKEIHKTLRMYDTEEEFKLEVFDRGNEPRTVFGRKKRIGNRFADIGQWDCFLQPKQLKLLADRAMKMTMDVKKQSEARKQKGKDIDDATEWDQRDGVYCPLVDSDDMLISLTDDDDPASESDDDLRTKTEDGESMGFKSLPRNMDPLEMAAAWSEEELKAKFNAGKRRVKASVRKKIPYQMMEKDDPFVTVKGGHNKCQIMYGFYNAYVLFVYSKIKTYVCPISFCRIG